MTWFRRDGEVMSEADWNSPQVGTLLAFLSGDSLDWTAADGTPTSGQSLLLIVHPDPADAPVTLPAALWADRYDLLLDTADDDLAGFPATLDRPARTFAAGETIIAAGRSVLVLRAAG
jgi:glycogen operon protein